MFNIKGFTLIELIVAIIIGSILATVVVNVMGTSLQQSGKPVNILKETYEINQVIEKINAAYREEVQNNSFDIVNFNTNLTNFNENDVTCSGTFLKYRFSDGSLIDSNGDQIYESQTSSSGPTNFLLVTASKNNHSIKVLLTK